MIMDISDATIRELARKHFNPTGTKHSPLPWHKTGETGIRTEDNFPVGYFRTEPDRDLALYFANVHAGVIAIIRNMADAFEFVARDASVSEAARAFATGEAERARIYAELFCRLGKPVPEPTEAPHAG